MCGAASEGAPALVSVVDTSKHTHGEVREVRARPWGRSGRRQASTQVLAWVVLSGGLAQLGEHLLCKQGVVGSIPSSSTTREATSEAQGRRMVSVAHGRGAHRERSTHRVFSSAG